MGSQWSLFSEGVMRSKRPTLQIRRAAAFCTLCSLCSWLLGNPYSRLLQTYKRLVTKAFTRIFVHSKLGNFLILWCCISENLRCYRCYLSECLSQLVHRTSSLGSWLCWLERCYSVSPAGMESMLNLASCSVSRSDYYGLIVV